MCEQRCEELGFVGENSRSCRSSESSAHDGRPLSEASDAPYEVFSAEEAEFAKASGAETVRTLRRAGSATLTLNPTTLYQNQCRGRDALQN